MPNRSSLRAQRSNLSITGLPLRTIAPLAMMLLVFFAFKNAHAQEKGLLASILEDSCQKYIKGQDTNNYDYQLFCSGYFEAIIEQKQNFENFDIYACFPTYGDYDPFKVRVVKKFIDKYELKKSQGNEYVRAFNLARDAIDEQYTLECKR